MALEVLAKGFSRRLRLVVLASAVSALWAGEVPGGGSRVDVFHHENVLGTSFELKVRSADPSVSARAEAAALSEIDRLSAIFSGYATDSEFSRWQSTRNAPVRVSPELFEVLAASEFWREQSQGAFNPTVELFSRLWKAGAEAGKLPSASDLAATVYRVAMPSYRLDRRAGAAERLTDLPMTLNAIAKGYIIDRASAAAWQVGGVETLLLELGGDLRVRGPVAETIAIANPARSDENANPIGFVSIHEMGLATSGGYRRGFRIGGQHYSHIIDPRNGQPVRHVPGVTVIAPDAATADALATSFSVLQPEESLRLADRTEGVACLLVLAGGQLERSARWPKETELSGQIRLAASQGPVPSAPIESMELAVNFEINRPEGGRYARPYVAIWIEDKDAFPVRTVLLWLLAPPKGERWYADLRRWSRRDQIRRLADDRDLVATVSSATRNPGKYDVVWDGKDDQGKLVPGGTYTIYIEAAREHGTYQLIKHEFTVGQQPFSVELPGNLEIKSASLEYRRGTRRP